MKEKYLSIQEAAKYTGYSEQWLRVIIRNRGINPVRILKPGRGRKYFYKKSDLDKIGEPQVD